MEDGDHTPLEPLLPGMDVRLLNALSVDLPPEHTLGLGRALAGLLVETYEARRLSPPRWVKDLLRHYEVA